MSFDLQSQHMEREAFLGRVATRQGPPMAAGPHLPPAPTDFEVDHRTLDGVDRADPRALLPVFLEAAARVGTAASVVAADDVAAAVARLASELGVRMAVLGAEPEVQALRRALEGAGVDAVDHDLEVAAGADLGITGAVAGVAATGSVVVSSAASGGRGATVLPTVHLCLLPLDRLRATTLDVLRECAELGLPSNLTFVTGPSRTGDIELILTVGVHGPVAVHVFVVD